MVQIPTLQLIDGNFMAHGLDNLASNLYTNSGFFKVQDFFPDVFLGEGRVM